MTAYSGGGDGELPQTLSSPTISTSQHMTPPGASRVSGGSTRTNSSGISPQQQIDRRVDPQLPRTWHRDLTYARDVLRGVSPLGVLWVSEIKSLQKERTTSYKLVILSQFRLYITSGKAGIMTGSVTNAHLFDLEKINVIQGDRIEFIFKKNNVIIEDTVGPAIVSAIWAALREISYEVPPSRLPALDIGAKNLIDADVKLSLQQTGSKSSGFIGTYRAACDHLGVKPKPSIEQYIVKLLGGDATPGNNESPTRTSSTAQDYDQAVVRIFDLGAAMRGDAAALSNTDTKPISKINDNDLPALSRALSVTTHFDALALSGSTSFASAHTNSAQITLSAEGARSLLQAIDSAPRMRRLLLVGVGLTAAKIDKLDAPNSFRKLTHLSLTDNPGLGAKGLAKLLGGHDNILHDDSKNNTTGPEKLERLECRGCGTLSKGLPLKKVWLSSLAYLDMTRCDLSKVSDTFFNWLKLAKVLEVLIVAHCGLVVQHLLAALAANETLNRGGILRVLDASLNKCCNQSSPTSMQPPMDEIGYSFVAGCINLERLVLAKCDLSVPLLENLLKGLEHRTKHAVSYSSPDGEQSGEDTSFPMPLTLNLADNPMNQKHGTLFYDRLSKPGTALRQLNLDRSYMGTLTLRDLFSALASSGAPHLAVLSLKCTASKGGLFANKRKHEDMARSLAEVILKCRALERLILSGGDGSHYKQDLLPAMAALASNTSLKVLDISNNVCGDEAIHALAGSLALNQTLTKLMIDGNSASASAVRALADAFQRNLSIYSCDLPRKDIALASRSLATDRERSDLAKAMKDMKEAIGRNASARAAKGCTTEEHRGSSTASSVPHRLSFSASRGYRGAAYAAFFSNLSDRDDDVDEDDEDDEGDGGTIGNDQSGESIGENDDISYGGLAEGQSELSEKGTSSSQNKDKDDQKSMYSLKKKPPKAPPPTNDNVAHRMKIFEEILETETNYVRDLGVICHSFLKPIESRELLKRDEIDQVFGNVSELRRIHEELLAKLRAAHRRHNDVIFAGKSSKLAAATDLARVHAQIFAEMVPFLRAYTVYCSTYTRAVDLVKQLSTEGSTKKNTKFAKFLQMSVKSPQCRGLDLSSFLIKPPQRLCKYPLFFRDLLKHMGESAADRDSSNLIAKTLDAVQDVTNAVNQNMASSGSQARVFEIFRNQLDAHESVSDLVSPTRRFLLEGLVDFASHEKAPKRHQFYLFNDLILLATPRRGITGADLPNKYKVKHRFALVDVAITDAPACISLNDNDHNFLIRFEDQGGGSNSVHWGGGSAGNASTNDIGPPTSTARPQRADFLLWCDDASKCEELRSTIQQACYDIRLLHINIQNRRKSLVSSTAVGSGSMRSTGGSSISSNAGSSRRAEGVEPDASDEDDEDTRQSQGTNRSWHGTAHLDVPNHTALTSPPRATSPPVLTRPNKPPPPPPQSKKANSAPAARPPPPADAQRSVPKVTRTTEM